MMNKKRKRILFGAVDIGYRINHYSDFIRKEFGDELIVESFSKYKLPDSHYPTDYTYVCEVQKRAPWYVYCYTTIFFIRALFRYQVFHFISGETILPWKLRRFELACYKLAGKKIIMQFVGSDIRSEKYLEEKNKHLPDYLEGNYTIQNPISEPFQQKLIQQARKYANKIVVSTPDLLQIIPEADYIPVFLDFNHFIYEESDKSSTKESVVSILHSPSAAKTKGSGHLTQLFKRLELKYGNTIKFVTPNKELGELKSYGTTRYDLLNKMAEADIVIDQLIIGWYGLKSVEALALKCEVVCYIDANLREYIRSDAPITHATVLTLEKTISTLIERIQSGKTDHQAKIDFVNTYHNMNRYRTYFYELWLK